MLRLLGYSAAYNNKKNNPLLPRPPEVIYGDNLFIHRCKNACIMSSADSDCYKLLVPIASRYKYYIIKRFVPQISVLSQIACRSVTDMKISVIARNGELKRCCC